MAFPSASKAPRKAALKKLGGALLALVLAAIVGGFAINAETEADHRAPSQAALQAQVDWEREVVPRALSQTTQLDGISLDVPTVEDAVARAQLPGAYINGNIPTFTEEDFAAALGTEEYSPLDRLGRCGPAFALVGPETEPTQPRGSISEIKPSGWRQAFYPELGIDHLYERSHLLAHCLTAEDANERNLITGTNCVNQGPMNTLEKKMDQYVDTTGGHLLLRVTPIFEGSDLVARGVQMEAYSLEDAGKSICFNLYLCNEQPGVQIDYATGASRAA